jgi:uncharacterized Tic20 family protein/DNA-directed RNA polymerase subunit RPC12/RpoP
MPVTVVCPSCKAKLKAPETLVGKAVKCPGCGSAVLVKAAAAAAPAAAPKAASGSAPKVPALAKGKPAPPPPPAKKPQPLDDLDPVDEVEDIEDYDEPVENITKAKPRKAPAAEEEPARGPVSDNDKTMGMLIHLAFLINLVFAPFGTVVPVAVWMMKRKESPFIDHNGKEWLNFNISMFVLWLVLLVVFGVLAGGGYFISGWVSFICVLLFGICSIALGLTMNIMMIIAGLKAKKGEWIRYKCMFRIFK